VESRFELGALHEAEKEFDQAAAIYRDILDNNPHNVQASMVLGHVYHQKGEKKRAAEIFASLGKRSVNDQQVFRTLVRNFLDIEDYESALIIIHGMLKGAPQSSELKYLYGVALDGVGKKDAAIEQLKQVEPGDRFFRNAAIRTALLYQETDQVQEAIDFIQETIEKDPQHPEFRLYLGSFYEQIESYDQAEAALKKGIELDPENPRLFFRLGVVYDKWGKKEDSIAAMRAVVKFEPDNANALNYLGYTFADMGINLDEAEQLIRKALVYKPGDGYITDSLAWVYYKRGQYEKALTLLEEAAAAVPDDPVIREHLGDVYQKLGMPQEALESYRQSIEQGHTDQNSIEEKIRQIEP
jgi:tetratricopeptide (TPR) repeat protein